MPNPKSEEQRDFPTEVAETLRSLIKKDFPNLEIVQVTWGEIRLEINVDQRTEFYFWDSLGFFGIRSKCNSDKWLYLINIARGGDAGNRAFVLHCQETVRRSRSDGPGIVNVEMFKRDSYELTSEEEKIAFVEIVQRMLQGGSR